MSDELPQVAPLWDQWVNDWADPRQRARITSGKVEGRESDSNLGTKILEAWLAAHVNRETIPAKLHSGALAVLNRISQPRYHNEAGPNNTTMRVFKGEAACVRGPDGKNYYLSTGPFEFRPVPVPAMPTQLHPGPGQPGQIAVVQVPEPVPVERFRQQPQTVAG